MANKKGPVIGLTGQTGAGKSTAAALLRAQGLAVIDADEIARKVTRPGSFVLSALAAAFGADLILPDGSLNRPLLAQRAFSSPGQTARLNAITHPAIIQQMRAETACAFRTKQKPWCWMRLSSLKAAKNRACDFIIAVVAPEELRIKRIMQRDQISEESARCV